MQNVLFSSDVLCSVWHHKDWRILIVLKMSFTWSKIMYTTSLFFSVCCISVHLITGETWFFSIVASFPLRWNEPIFSLSYLICTKFWPKNSNIPGVWKMSRLYMLVSSVKIWLFISVYSSTRGGFYFVYVWIFMKKCWIMSMKYIANKREIKKTFV